MLAWHVLLSGSKQGCESGGWLETLLSSPAVIHGGVGNVRFGGLEWREPHVLLSILDQLRCGVLSVRSGRGLDVGWAGFTWTSKLSAPSLHGFCLGWSSLVSDSCGVDGIMTYLLSQSPQCVHPQNRAGVSMLCPWCWQGRQRDCENGPAGLVARPWLVSASL